MDANIAATRSSSISLVDAERSITFGAGVLLLVVGASRRSAAGTWLAASSTPLIYRGLTGHWPKIFNGHADRDGTKSALAGPRGIHVQESIRLEVPIAEAYQFWRRLDRLPQVMTHLQRVTETGNGTSHWVAKAPGGMVVEWDAEIINEIENKLLAWRSLPAADVVTAGSVTFASVRGGRSTQVSVHLQYAPPAGKAGALVAQLFGDEPSQTIREDLRHFKQLLEAGEIPRATAHT